MKLIAKYSILLFLVAGTLPYCYAQDIYSSYMELVTTKNPDGTRDLTAKLTADSDEGEFFVSNVPVNFVVMADGEEVDLGRANTNEDGEAIFTVQHNYVFPKDEEDYITLYSRFEGNDQYESSEAELIFKDTRLEVAFYYDEDSVKMIEVSGYIQTADGTEVPLMDDDVYLYVPRMFNLMKFEDGWLEEDGKSRTEFPATLIGDTTGMVKVIARIEEHYDYGNVSAEASINWAIPKHSKHVESFYRELWTPTAPLWMIVTLIIMLAGVWGHYLYAMYQLYMIRKLSKKK